MKLEDLRGWMKGEDGVVVACGPSARDSYIYANRRRWIIACNRAVTFAVPDFAVCVEPPDDTELWEIITAASPLVVFAQADNPHPRAVTINIDNVLPWLMPERTRGLPPAKPLRLAKSPFFAAAVAAVLGFETIGIIGVDYTADRFDDAQINRDNARWDRLGNVVHEMGSRLVNLSPESRLSEFISKGNWEEIRVKGAGEVVQA